MSPDEKRNRKNEMARIRRANGKNSVVDTEQTERTEPDSVPEPSREPTPEPEPTPPTAEDIERKGKRLSMKSVVSRL